MKMKIVADSSANLLALPDIDFGIVPLHVIVGENDYVDDDKIDLTAMQEDLSSYKGKTSTSSPSPHEWENAFGDADVVFCITITSTLSGTYNSAVCLLYTSARTMIASTAPNKILFNTLFIMILIYSP